MPSLCILAPLAPIGQSAIRAHSGWQELQLLWRSKAIEKRVEPHEDARPQHPSAEMALELLVRLESADCSGLVLASLVSDTACQDLVFIEGQRALFVSSEYGLRDQPAREGGCINSPYPSIHPDSRLPNLLPIALERWTPRRPRD